jgi:hypothetical protein
VSEFFNFILLHLLITLLVNKWTIGDWKERGEERRALRRGRCALGCSAIEGEGEKRGDWEKSITEGKVCIGL